MMREKNWGNVFCIALNHVMVKQCYFCGDFDESSALITIGNLLNRIITQETSWSSFGLYRYEKPVKRNPM
jgi:hypothetical protein